jgi:hypothetical protein
VSSLNGKRLWWLATCIVFVACASAPAPTPTKKKKKKKKKKRDDIALKQDKDAERNEDEEKPDKPAKKAKDDDEDKPSKKAKDDDEDKPSKKAKDDNEDRPSKKAKSIKDDEVAVADDDVTVVDDDGETPSKKKKSKADQKKKKAEAAEAAAEKKRQQEEQAAEAAAEKKRKKEEAAEAAADKKRKQEEEAAEAAAAKKKRKKAEEIAEEEPPPDEEEPKPKKGKQVAVKGKKNGKAKKQAEEEEIDLAAEEPPPDEEEAKPVKKKPEKVAAKAKADKKAKSAPAEVDMTSTDGPVIDMEDDAGSSLDTRVDDEPPAGRVAAIPVPGVDDGTDEQSVSAAATPVGSDPRVINERPLVLGNSKLAVHGGLRVGVLTVEPMGAPKASRTSTGFALGGAYGVGDNTEIGLDYTLGVSPASAKGPVTFHGAYRAIDGKLDMAIAAALAIDPTPVVDFTTGQETANTFVSLQLGAWARYRLTRNVSLFSGLPALPASAVSLTKYALPLPPQPYQLAIGLNNAGTIALDIPIGLGYQINPKLYALGALDLAHIRIANTENAFLFRDFIPVSLGAFYVLDKLDLGATLSNDFDKGFDLVHFDTFVRYSIK